MLEDIFRPDEQAIAGITWNGDHYQYDYELYQLGADHPRSLVINPKIKDKNIVFFADEIPDTEKCVVFCYDGDWVAKLFTQGWEPHWNAYKEVLIEKPTLAWTKNPEIDKLMEFEEDIINNFEIEPWDLDYNLVWYMSPKYNPTPEKIWAISCQAVGREIKGIKEMGYVTPAVDIEYNEYLPDLGIDLDDCYPAYWELTEECAWELDPIHQTEDQRLWVVKFCPRYRRPKTWKWLGIITPTFKVTYNPNLPKMDYDIDYVIPWHDFTFEHVWMLDTKHLREGEKEIWVFKIQVSNDVEGDKFIDYVSPNLHIELNSDLPELEYNIDFTILWHDFKFEHIWMLDRKHLKNGEDDIWAIKVKASKKPKGSKFIGYVSPEVYLEFNDDLPRLNYNIDYIVPWHDFKFEHLWLLDRKHLTNGEDDIWTFKIKFLDSPKGSKFIDYISPIPQIEYNKVLPKLKYNIDYIVPWHDFKFEHVWMLDRKHIHNDEDDIWSAKIKFLDKPQGSKFIDYIAPIENIEYNPDLKGMTFDVGEVPYYHLQYKNIWMIDNIWAMKKSFVEDTEGDKYLEDIEPVYEISFNDSIKNLYVEIDYQIPVYDRSYEHIWYTDLNGEKVWVAKYTISSVITGTKEMGNVIPMLPPRLDVVFISYDEPNAEDNWHRLLEKAPYAKRVTGVKGILNAHKAAAELAETDMFYVVDADAWIVDEWNFDFQPGLYDRDCVYVWQSANPFNDITYGYGGVKLFPTLKLKNTVNWGTDLTLSVGKKIKVMDTVSNITKFNTSEYNTWRSAFRECAKLSKKDDQESKNRLDKWSTPNLKEKHSKWVKLGAEQAIEFAANNSSVNKINNYVWLKEYFERLNGRR